MTATEPTLTEERAFSAAMREPTLDVPFMIANECSDENRGALAAGIEAQQFRIGMAMDIKDGAVVLGSLWYQIQVITATRERLPIFKIRAVIVLASLACQHHLLYIFPMITSEIHRRKLLGPSREQRTAVKGNPQVVIHGLCAPLPIKE